MTPQTVMWKSEICDMDTVQLMFYNISAQDKGSLANLLYFISACPVSQGIRNVIKNQAVVRIKSVYLNIGGVAIRMQGTDSGSKVLSRALKKTKAGFIKGKTMTAILT